MTWLHIYIGGGLAHFFVSLYGLAKAMTDGDMMMRGPADEDTMRAVLGISLFVTAIGNACIWPLATVAQIATALIMKSGNGPAGRRSRRRRSRRGSVIGFREGWPHRLVVRTLPSQGRNTSSNLVGAASGGSRENGVTIRAWRTRIRGDKLNLRVNGACDVELRWMPRLLVPNTSVMPLW